MLRLVEVLRDDENPKAVELLNLIRSNASLDEIRRSVADRLDSLSYASAERPSLDRLRDEIDVAQGNNPNTRRKVMDINRLCDVTLFKVPAKPWTSLTSDDDLVSHLLSLWFSWQQQGFYCINRDLFVRDMQSADLNSKFCSPFLVNILLAEACVSGPPCIGVAIMTGFPLFGSSFTQIIPKPLQNTRIPRPRECTSITRQKVC